MSLRWRHAGEGLHGRLPNDIGVLGSPVDNAREVSEVLFGSDTDDTVGLSEGISRVASV